MFLFCQNVCLLHEWNNFAAAEQLSEYCSCSAVDCKDCRRDDPAFVQCRAPDGVCICACLWVYAYLRVRVCMILLIQYNYCLEVVCSAAEFKGCLVGTTQILSSVQPLMVYLSVRACVRACAVSYTHLTLPTKDCV